MAEMSAAVISGVGADGRGFAIAPSQAPQCRHQYEELDLEVLRFARRSERPLLSLCFSYEALAEMRA